MNFCSDNTTGAADEVLAAIATTNDGATMPYGNDDLTRRAEAAIAEAFETEADVFLLASGTAANALCLSVMAPPFGAVYCHAQSHIHTHECGAPEFYTGGAKLLPMEGDHGRIRGADLKNLLWPTLTPTSITCAPPPSASPRPPRPVPFTPLTRSLRSRTWPTPAA